MWNILTAISKRSPFSPHYVQDADQLPCRYVANSYKQINTTSKNKQVRLLIILVYVF